MKQFNKFKIGDKVVPMIVMRHRKSFYGIIDKIDVQIDKYGEKFNRYHVKAFTDNYDKISSIGRFFAENELLKI